MEAHGPNLDPGPGVSLTDAHGDYLGSVRHAQPDRLNPGSVQMHLWSLDPERLESGSGDWRVCDRYLETLYCVQALSVQPAGIGFDLVVSSLGEQTVFKEDKDEDYLVVEGGPPVPLGGFLVADNQCPGGPHVRCEFPARFLRGLPIDLSRPRSCDCGSALRCKIQQGDPEPGRRWGFCRTRLSERPDLDTACAKIVRLKQRTTILCRFNVALPRSDAGTAVMIGHAYASEHWFSARRTDRAASNAEKARPELLRAASKKRPEPNP